MNITIINKICLARNLFELAITCLKSRNELQLFATANLLQDSIEAFLLAVTENVEAPVDSNTKFDQYFSRINEKTTPYKLPFQTQLTRLNRIRIDSKHFAIKPDRDECEKLSIVVREFFEEVSNRIFSVNFGAVSTLDLLEDGESKEFLLQAKEDLIQGNHQSCSVNCRKALFIEVEKEYDISYLKYEDNLLNLRRQKSPWFAQSKEYLDKYITCPTDYIVLDHSTLDRELLSLSIDPYCFWNIWRITPDIIRTHDGEWIVKEEFDKLEHDFLHEHIDYIYSTTVDIILTKHTKKRLFKYSTNKKLKIKVKDPEPPVYEKADIHSKQVGTIPKTVHQIECTYRIKGLNDESYYYYIIYINLREHIFLVGFIPDNHIIFTGE